MRYLILGREEKSGSNAEDVFLQPDIGGAQRGIRNIKLFLMESSLDSLAGISQSFTNLHLSLATTSRSQPPSRLLWRLSRRNC